MIITLLKTTKNAEKSFIAPIRDSAKLMRAMNDLDGPMYEIASTFSGLLQSFPYVRHIRKHVYMDLHLGLIRPIKAMIPTRTLAHVKKQPHTSGHRKSTLQLLSLLIIIPLPTL